MLDHHEGDNASELGGAEFATPPKRHSERDSRAARSNTSSLDGLRGYAALAVMNYHILYAYQSAVFYGYGLSHTAALQCARPDDVDAHNRWLHQLPVVRLVYTGTWPISVFFVISGFALSYKPLAESQNSFSSSVSATASSLLRRPFRLFGPPILATFVTMLAIQLGAYEHGRQISRDPHWVPVINEVHQVRYQTFVSQLLDWLQQTWRMFHVFWWGDLHNKYDVHLWTIPTEFRCSLAIFLILPVYVSIRPAVRKVLMVVLIFYVYALDRWDVALFYAGLLIADTAIRGDSACDELPTKDSSHRVLSRALRIVLLMLSLLCLSSPDFCIESTPGYEVLARLIPSSDPAPFRFVPNLGGILLVALLAHTGPSNPIVSRMLNSALPQYLGRISYSLYIIHGPLIHTLGYAVFPFFWTITGRNEGWRYLAGFGAAYMVLLASAIGMADLFWRMVDEPCVRLARAVRDRVIL
ncbi:hypothetical protein GQ53DRAFT_768016 [Thozetella sp. PMI_491]|nr:hypothetical protein GQ53DRAFT_768016 [Thozetella sp. PMI_491]